MTYEYNSNYGVCYFLLPNVMSWNIAKTNCETYGGMLAVITEEKHMAFIRDHILHRYVNI